MKQEKRDKHLGITITSELHRKLVYISKYEGRTMSGQILYLIQKCVRDFERENGPIEVEDKKP